MEKGLIHFDQARAALAQITTIDEAKALRDKAEAARVYAKQAKYSLIVQNDCAEIKIWAERKAGELLSEMAEKGERATRGGDRKSKSHDDTLKLVDLGVDSNQSKRWQRMASIPEQVFKEHIRGTKASGEELTTASVLRIAQEEKKKEKIERLKEIEAQPVEKFSGLYDVIVADPPWPMQKIERDCRPNQVGFDYPVMTLEEIADAKPPMADDCHLWLWTTHKFLPDAFDILETWGVRYVCTFVWHKSGGFQPVGLPQYNCEFALYARRGSPLFADTKDFSVCLSAPRGSHSEKPDAFYDMVRRVTSGRRFDMYSRREIEGFDGWGKESC